MTLMLCIVVKHMIPRLGYEFSENGDTPQNMLNRAGFTGENVFVIDPPISAELALDNLMAALIVTGNTVSLEPNFEELYKIGKRYIRASFSDCINRVGEIIVPMNQNFSACQMALNLLIYTPIPQPTRWNPGRRTGSPHFGHMSQWNLNQKRPIMSYYDRMTYNA